MSDSANNTGDMPMSAGRIALIMLGFAVGSWLLYWPVVSFEFVNYDDYTVLLNHPGLYGAETMSAGLRAIFFDYFPREEPLLIRDVTWMMDAAIHGFTNPRGYHLTNVLLNGVNVALLFLWLVLDTRKHIFAMVVCALFAVLTLHVEPVAWTMGRKDLLSMMFFLLLMICHGRSVRAASLPLRIGLYVLTLLLLTLALLSKISGLTFFLVLAFHRVALDLYDGRLDWELKPVFQALIKSGVAVVPHFAISLGVYFWYRGILSEYGVLNSTSLVETGEHIRNLFLLNPLVLLVYIKNLFFPHDLSGRYEWPSIYYPLSGMDYALIALAFVLVIGLAIYLWFRHRILLFFYLAFAALMIPYLNLVYIGIWVANRYMYLSSFAMVALVVAPLLTWFAREKRPIRMLAPTLLVIWFGVNLVQTLRYMHAWSTELALWNNEMSRSRPTLFAFTLLANNHIGQIREMEDGPEKTKQLQETSALVDRGLDIHLDNVGEKVNPIIHKLLYCKALVKELQGADVAEVRKYCQMALKWGPGFDPAVLKISDLAYTEALAATAMSKKRAKANEAFTWFRRYVKTIGHDRAKMAAAAPRLKKFQDDFPFLADKIQQYFYKYQR